MVGNDINPSGAILAELVTKVLELAHLSYVGFAVNMKNTKPANVTRDFIRAPK